MTSVSLLPGGVFARRSATFVRARLPPTGRAGRHVIEVNLLRLDSTNRYPGRAWPRGLA